MSSKKAPNKNVKFFVASNTNSRTPEILTAPSNNPDFPTMFVDFPLIKAGVRHLVTGSDDRYSQSPDRKLSIRVRNPLSPAAFKLLMLLISRRQKSVLMKANDLMEVAADPAKITRDLSSFLNNIQNVRMTFASKDSSLVPEDLRGFITYGEGTKLLENIIIVSSIGETVNRRKGKPRIVKVNFSREFMIFCNASLSGYIKSDTETLKQLTNKYPEELLTYLLALKVQKRHSQEFLTNYYLNCSKEFLAGIPDEKVGSVIRTIARIYPRILESLKKLKGIKVISNYSFEESRLKVGNGSRTAPFFENLTITKSSPTKETTRE